MHSPAAQQIVVAPEVLDLEVFAQEKGVDLREAIAHAGVAKTTYWRWCNEGVEPHTPTLRKIRAAIAELADGAAR
jgi:hypothetical protein